MGARGAVRRHSLAIIGAIWTKGLRQTKAKVSNPAFRVKGESHAIKQSKSDSRRLDVRDAQELGHLAVASTGEGGVIEDDGGGGSTDRGRQRCEGAKQVK